MAQVASELISVTRDEKLTDSKYIKDEALENKKQSDINKDSLAGGVYNVTKLRPLQSGYYTITTAIAAVPQALRCIGMVITYQTASDSWETKQFKGILSDWSDSSKWEDFGGGKAGDGVYDISEAYPSASPFASLQAALTAFTDTTKQKPGMTIKYIDSNNGRYKTYHLTTQSWSNQEVDWIEDIPTRVFYKINLSEYTEAMGMISKTGTIDTSGSGKHIRVRVDSSKKYKLSVSGWYGWFASEAATTAMSVFTGDEPYRAAVRLNEPKLLTVPNGATHLCLMTADYHGNVPQFCLEWYEEQGLDILKEEIETIERANDKTDEVISIDDKVIFNKTVQSEASKSNRYFCPTLFEVGKTYLFELSIPSAATAEIRIYVGLSSDKNNNTLFQIGSIAANSTSTKFDYSPQSGTNYQFICFWNYGATRNVTLKITEKSDIKNIKELTESAVNYIDGIEDKKYLEGILKNLDVLSSEKIEVSDLPIKDCSITSNGRWYSDTQTLLVKPNHVYIEVNEGDIIVFKYFSGFCAWCSSSYNPNTQYTNNTDVPIIGSRIAINNDNKFLKAPSGAKYLILVLANGDGQRFNHKIVYKVTDYADIEIADGESYPTVMGKSVSDWISGTNDANVITCSIGIGWITFGANSKSGGKYAYGGIKGLTVGNKYHLQFNGAAQTRVPATESYPGLLVLAYADPLTSSYKEYTYYILGKTNETSFVYDFEAKSETLYFRCSANDFGNPLYGKPYIVLRNIKLIDLGKSDLKEVIPTLMEPALSNITERIDNSTIIDVDDNGLYVVDRYLNVGAYLDETGLHVNN